jgi:1,4-dihydroxy-2-naphthoate octaprenyltransferase
MSILKQAITDRLSGERPGPLRAALAAVVAGTAVATVTYKALRH